MFRQRPDSLQEEGMHTRKHGHGVLGTVLASYSASSCRSLLPRLHFRFRDRAIMKKEGAVAPAPSAPASWMCFWPTLPAGYLRSPHLLPAAMWGRFLAKFSLPVANANLNPFHRFFFWGGPLQRCFFNDFFFTIKRRYFSDV